MAGLQPAGVCRRFQPVVGGALLLFFFLSYFSRALAGLVSMCDSDLADQAIPSPAEAG
jgi:hypothetical protein